MTRAGWLASTTLAALAAGASAVVPAAPRFIWNASASAPVGLYLVEPAGRLEVADLVIVEPPRWLASFLADRGYIARRVPLLKRVLALPGQRTCRDGVIVTVDGTAVGNALRRDPQGRALPVWQGCRVVAAAEVFLMNWAVPDSLDGRYFGPLPRSAVIGRAAPLWTDEDGNGRFVWRALTR